MMTRVLMTNGFGWLMLEDILIQGVLWISSLLNGFWGVWFCQSRTLGDTVEEALNKMRQTDPTPT